MTATDNDPGDNGVLVYSMVVRHTEEQMFDIRTIGKTGEVYSLKTFDRENPEGITKIGEIFEHCCNTLTIMMKMKYLFAGHLMSQ